MRRLFNSAVMVACFSLASLLRADLPSKPGIHQQTLKTDKIRELRYTLSLPESFPTATPAPLIVALHYGGEVTPWYGEPYLEVLVEPALRELGAIIVAPDCPATNGWNNPSAEAAVLELVAAIKRGYRIDDRKVLLTGYSMGGVGTWYLAMRHPQLFSAAIPISSQPDPEVIEKLKGIPVLAIHGRGDERFPAKRLEAAIQKMKDKGVPVQLRIVDGLTHFQTVAFAGPLQAAVPWVRRIWNGGAK